MSLKDKLQADLKDAMRQGDENRKLALRLTMAEIKNAEVAKMSPLSEEEELALLRREVKRRRETIAELEAAGNRPEFLGAERAQLAILEAYLPQQLTREQIEARAKDVIGEIGEIGVVGPSAKGQVMKRLMPLLQGQADGKLVQEVVNELLSGRT